MNLSSDIQIYNCKNTDLDLEPESVDLIYGDILYGTGNKFKDAYQDITSDPYVVADTYMPVLVHLYKLLKPTGQIVLQMDYRINYLLRSLMNHVFGDKNFRNEMIWVYNSAPHKKGCLGHRHDTLLRYSKSDIFTFNEIREPYSETAPRGYAKEKYYHPDGKLIGDVWDDVKMLGQNDKTERTGYPTQKPVKLIERIVTLFSNKGDTVLDPYMGSGTTMEACMNLARKFIGCDSSEQAFEVTLNRYKKLTI